MLSFRLDLDLKRKKNILKFQPIVIQILFIGYFFRIGARERNVENNNPWQQFSIFFLKSALKNLKFIWSSRKKFFFSKKGAYIIAQSTKTKTKDMERN